MKIRQKKMKSVQRSFAWMLTFAMILTCGNSPVSEKKAKAASTSYDLSVKSGSSNGTVTLEDNKNGDDYISDVLFNIPSQAESRSALSTYGITSMEVKVTINSFSASEGSPQVLLYVQPDNSGSWAWNQTDGVAMENGKQITVTFDFSSMNWNGGSKMGNLGLRFVNSADGTTVSYSIDSAKLIASEANSGTGSNTNDWGITREYSSGVNVTVSNQGSPSNDWSGFDITMVNNSGSSICDWVIVLEVPSGVASAFKCWNATFVADGDTIYLYPMQTGANAVVSTGKLSSDVPGGGFMSKYVDASQINVKTVYYNKGTQSEYDYSSGETNDSGSGSGGSGSATDTSTNKDLEVEYNYAKALQSSLYFYDANMCGTQVEDNCGLDWRGNCHTEDANVSCTVDGKTYQVDVSGGFHDAGDHVKFGLPQGYAATSLGVSYYKFKDAYTDLNLADHLKTITNYFCDYFKRSTVYSDNDARTGGVVAFCYQVGEGNADHGYWGAPELQSGSRPAYFATASNPATDEVSLAIAALAVNYINFGVEEDLQVAKDLFDFVKNNSKSCATEGAGSFYSSSSWQDDYATAAAALYVATGDSSYQQEYSNNKSGINSGWLMDWDNSGALATMLMRDWSVLKQITNNKSNGTVLDSVYNCISDWGSCRYNTAMQFCGLVYDQGTGSTEYTQWAEKQMRYIIGENPNKRCYIVGYNENSSKYPHHRAASRSSSAGEIREDHYTLLGALVGGPKQDGSYADSQGDYICNEVALDYNVGLVGAAAGLYCAKKGTVADDYSEKLMSSEELSGIGVTKFYGVSDLPEVTNSPTPTTVATATPTTKPTATTVVTATPTTKPTATTVVTATPTTKPTATTVVTATPTTKPTATTVVTTAPTPGVTSTPVLTETPAASSTPQPTKTATANPTANPSPTETPTVTESPTPSESPEPTATTTTTPTIEPTTTPLVTATPIIETTVTPAVTAVPTTEPTTTPTVTPSVKPSEAPQSTTTPTVTPSVKPSEAPQSTTTPTVTPSVKPSETPESTTTPTATVAPTVKPTETPESTSPTVTTDPTASPEGTNPSETPDPTTAPDPIKTPQPTASPSPSPTGNAGAGENTAAAFESDHYEIYVTQELILDVTGNVTVVSYESSDATVAAVDSDGFVSGKKEGTATITGKLSDGTQITCQVTVKKPTVTLKKKTIKVKKKKKTTIQFKKKISSDSIKQCKVVGKKVVKVTKKGVVKGIKYGKATIKITMKSGVVVKCKVKVV